MAKSAEQAPLYQGESNSRVRLLHPTAVACRWISKENQACPRAAATSPRIFAITAA